MTINGNREFDVISAQRTMTDNRAGRSPARRSIRHRARNT
ncbi:hypothetical protein C7S14_7995 [Burkholderia cepacia]|nr:hypothetical protein C7S14_7995 [Burkholderia cepacia]